MKRTVIEMLKGATQKFKNTPYVSDKTDEGWVSKTFEDVDNLSDIIAVSLIDRQMAYQDKVCILAEGRSQWIISEYALLKIGVISVPLATKLQSEELYFRIQHSEAKAIIISKNLVPKVLLMSEGLNSLGVEVIYLDSKQDVQYDQLCQKINKVCAYSDLLIIGEQKREEYSQELNRRIANIDEQDVATISYTSGTTGNPKGIMLTHLNYFANSHDALGHFKLENYLKLLIILPIDHSFTHTIGFYVATLCAIHIYFVDSRGGATKQLKNIPINIKEVNPDFMLSVPALTGNFMRKIQDTINDKGGFVKWLFNIGLKHGINYYQDGFKKPSLKNRIINYPLYKLADALVFKKIRKIFGSNFKFFIGGGAALEIKQQQFFYTIGAPVYQGYGLTEASPIISVNLREKPKFGSSGTPFVKCFILDSDFNEVPVGQKGVLAIRALSVMKGYYKNPEATSQTIINDGLLITGDMSYIDEDGFLYVIGREKALLISSDGEKYSPESIEEAIVNCSDLVYQVVLYNDHCKYTTALITLDQNRLKKYVEQHKLTDLDKILDVVKDSFFKFTNDNVYKNQFPKQWIPSVFGIIDEPFSEQNNLMNSTMKLKRFAILETYKDVLDRMQTLDGKIYCQQNKDAIKKILS